MGKSRAEKYLDGRMTCDRRGPPVTQSRRACLKCFVTAADPDRRGTPATGSDWLADCVDCPTGREIAEKYQQLESGTRNEYMSPIPEKEEESMKKEFECRWCGRTFGRPAALGRHEQCCPQNPNRKPAGRPKKKTAPPKRNAAVSAAREAGEDTGATGEKIPKLYVVSINPEASLDELLAHRDEVEKAIRRKMGGAQ